MKCIRPRLQVFVACLLLAPAFAQPAEPPADETPVNLDEHPDMTPAGMNGATAGDAMRAMHAEAAAFAAPAASGIEPVFTRSGSNLRYGTYLKETRLTPDVVRHGLELLGTLHAPGDTHPEAQPLFAPKVPTHDGLHDLVIVATNADQVWAFDANTYEVQWTRTVGKPVKSIQKIDGWLTNDHFGIMSTPVIDGGNVYVVAWVSTDGKMATARHELFEVRLADGVILRSLPLPGSQAMPRKQRAALSFLKVKNVRTLLIPWGTIYETAAGAHGFLTAVNLDKWKIVSEWSSSPNGRGAGLWMAGAGPVLDAEGYIYLMTGNGDFDPAQGNFSESFVKLRYDGKTFKVVDWWAPFTDAARVKDLSPDDTKKWNDSDLGAGAPVVIPEMQLVGGAGKDSIWYQMDWRRMGKPTAAELGNAGQNYARLLAPPIFLGFNGIGINAHPDDPRQLNQLFYNQTHHQHGAPIYWNGKLFNMCENGNVRMWTVSRDGLKFVARSAEVASPFSNTPPGGMPGGMMALSANGNQNGVLWAIVPDGDANQTTTTARVFAFDAQALGGKFGDGDTQLPRLWMSDPHHQYVKFGVPVVNDGRLWVPTSDGTIQVWGRPGPGS